MVFYIQKFHQSVQLFNKILLKKYNKNDYKINKILTASMLYCFYIPANNEISRDFNFQINRQLNKR